MASVQATRNRPGLEASSIRGLYATPTALLPFMRGVVIRAFVLAGEAGTVIVYNAPGISAVAAEIAALGPIDRLLVNHWHEGMFADPSFAVPAYVHELDRRQTAMTIAGTFSRRERIADDLEVIPTPGHTAGATMFLWDNGAQRVLFPGDTIWVQGGAWKAVLLGESDRDDYVASLRLLLDVEFDYLVPWGAEEDAPFAHAVTQEEARQNLQQIIDRLEAGQGG